MKAEILAVGTELLTPSRVETNALYIGRRLQESGISVMARTTVADDLSVLTASFKTALERCDLVIATGGLGPTADDLTREAAAAALSRPLRRDEGILEGLRVRFAKFNRVMAPVNAQQADVIEGGRALPNANGTAPGQFVEASGKLLFLLPGPPREMEPMFVEQVLPELVRRVSGRVLRTRLMRIAGGESDVEQLVAPIYTTYENPTTTILGGAGEVELHFTASGSTAEEAESRIEPLASAVREKLGHRIFAEDGRTLPQVVGDLLRDRGLTIALAESCTGGLLAARLTEWPGSSAFLHSSFVTYANEAKIALLGVPRLLLDEKGAVSEEVAKAMASGVRTATGASIGVGITGIAGPDGGSPEKPVGLVYLALSGAAGEGTRRAHFPGDRERIRLQATQAALDMIRRGLLGLGPSS